MLFNKIVLTNCITFIINFLNLPLCQKNVKLSDQLFCDVNIISNKYNDHDIRISRYDSESKLTRNFIWHFDIEHLRRK